MSDTKALIKYVSARMNDGPNITFGKPTVLDLVEALEQAEACAKDNSDALTAAYMSGKYDGRKEAEARAEKAENELAGADAEISELRDELEDSRGTEKDAPNILCAIARLVGVFEHCQELGDDMGEMTLDAVSDLLAEKQKAEANVARLTKERDWLAGRCAEELGFSEGLFKERKATANEWKEAARRAVAAGEE